MTDGAGDRTDDAAGIVKVDPGRACVSTALGVLGRTGMTAYFSLLDVGRITAGETILVSTAAGATGSIAGQIARIRGCRAVGLVGSEEKARFVVRDLGFDAAVDYRNRTNSIARFPGVVPGASMCTSTWSAAIWRIVCFRT